MKNIAKVDLKQEASAVVDDWKNWVLAHVNDHVVRISVMTRDFHWHRHTNSDEVLLALEGSLIVDFEDQSLTVDAGQFVLVPRRPCTGPGRRASASSRCRSSTKTPRSLAVNGAPSPASARQCATSRTTAP